MNLPLVALFLAVLTPAQLPFTVDASEDASSEFPGAPHIQSFAFGQWKGRWVFIGGRTAGYHSVGGGPAEFLRADANRDVWVVDTTQRPARAYHAPIDQLPASLAPVKDQWGSTGLLYFQEAAKLYVSGGYGQDHAGKWVTFPLISQVDLPALVDGVMQGRIPAETIVFTRTPLVQSTGGVLTKLPDGYFYLLMGHVFQGSYTAFEGQGEHNAEAVSQTYLNEIRKLKITPGHGSLDVTLVEKFEDEVEFHRRDLNVTQIFSPAGLGLAAYGGVFTPETQLSYSKPVYLFGGSRPAVDTSFDQKMNAYSSPTLLIYDRAASTMYTTFFGGISRYLWDAVTQRFLENPRIGTKTESTYLDGMQWSDQISTLQRVMVPGKEQTTEMVHPRSLPGFVGTDGVFIPSPELARAHPGTDILDLQPLRGTKTFVGYIYGGIRAFPYRFPYTKGSQPYNAGAIPTKPNDLVLKVYVEAGAR